MKFETVRIHFFGEDFRCRCRRGGFFFLFVCFLLVIFLSVVGDWHKFYAYFFASYFHEQLVFYSVLTGCWVWREVSFLL